MPPACLARPCPPCGIARGGRCRCPGAALVGGGRPRGSILFGLQVSLGPSPWLVLVLRPGMRFPADSSTGHDDVAHVLAAVRALRLWDGARALVVLRADAGTPAK
eukprot:9802925-Lingulodinium_polyedra.AAC.1